VRRVLLVAVFASFISGASCIEPPPEARNPTIEQSSPEKPKRQIELEKALKEEFKKQPEPSPER
jgi:hypothetical protein